MANRLSNKTAAEFQADIIARLKSYTTKDITGILWNRLINVKVDMIHELMSSKDKEVYKDHVVLNMDFGTKPGGFLSGVDEQCFINGDNLYIADSFFSGGYFSPAINSIDDISVGSIVWLKKQEGGTSPYTGRVTAVDIPTKKLVLSPTPPAAGYLFDCMIIAGSVVGTADDIYIAGETWYKYIDQIQSIYCTGNEEEAILCESISQFFGIKKLVNYNHTDSIICVRDGEYLKFIKGSGVSEYGTRTMYYTRRPYAIASDTDCIDIPNANMDLLFKLCMIDGLTTIKVPIPEELAGAKSQIAEMQNAKDKEIVEFLAKRSSN